MEPNRTTPAETARRRIERRLFPLLWIVFAFFHQGGGWNQNGRFATVRSVVEAGRLSIDSYLLYTNIEEVPGGFELKRKLLDNGHFIGHGRDNILGWTKEGQLRPVQEAPVDTNVVPLDQVTCTGELAFRSGRFYHRSAPGTALLGVPAYFVLFHVERMAGISPDNWWALTVNAWLTSAFSVALVSALGCLLFFRLGLLLWGEERKLEALLATLTFAGGTLFLPYATMFYEHNVAAIGLVAALYFVLRRIPEPGDRPRRALVMGGSAAGLAAAASYSALVPALLLAVYLGFGRSRRRSCLWFLAGLAAPLVLLAILHAASFGGPLTSAYDLEGPDHHVAGNSFLDKLGPPSLIRLASLLFSPFRGLFVGSPVLLLGVVGLVRLWSRRERRAEAALLTAIVAFYLLLVMSYAGWHGGWAVGPRYLLPALPFLALPLTWAFIRWFKTTSMFALASVLGFGLLTAVDPQSPIGTASFASIPDRAGWRNSPLFDYALPVFFQGRAAPVLAAKLEQFMGQAERDLELEGVAPEARDDRLAAYRGELEHALAGGQPPFTLAQFRGPVSANPTGYYESWFGRLFQPAMPQAGWNSFNAGELLLRASRFSLLPLLVVLVLLLPGALRLARAGRPSPERVTRSGEEAQGATASME